MKALFASLAIAASTVEILANIPTYSLDRVGLIGVDYPIPAPGGITRLDDALGMNLSGMVVGQTRHLRSNGLPAGIDAWIFDGSSNRQVGLDGPIYRIANSTSPSGSYRFSPPVGIDRLGRTAGIANIYENGIEVGTDAWFDDGTQATSIGLAGSEYYSNGDPLRRRSNTIGLGSGGHAIGITDRTGNGAYLGTDAWVYSGNQTVVIGFVGPQTDLVTAGGISRVNVPLFVNATGQVAGKNDLVRQAWFFDGVGTVRIGLTGDEYVGNDARTAVIALNDAGQVGGVTDRSQSNGKDSWVYSNGVTRQVGLTGTGYESVQGSNTYRFSRVGAVNRSGVSAGFSVRFTAAGEERGEDAWINVNGVTRAIALTGAEYERAGSGDLKFHESEPAALNNSNIVAGYSSRFSGDFQNGRDVWVDTGNGPRIANPTGSGLDYISGPGAAIYRSSSFSGINDNGLVIGTTQRRSPSGNLVGDTGWVHNYLTDVTTRLEFNVRASDGMSITRPAIVTPDGTVLGTYELYSGGVDLGARAFWWRADVGMRDLGKLVGGGIASEGWLSLSDVFDRTIPGVQPGVAGDAAFVLGNGTTVDSFLAPYRLVAVAVAGDYNNDGYVDASDYTVWADHFGQTGVGTPGDGNGDNLVNAADYTVWADHFGQGTPPGATSIPEPSAMAGLGLGALALGCKPRR